MRRQTIITCIDDNKKNTSLHKEPLIDKHTQKLYGSFQRWLTLQSMVMFEVMHQFGDEVDMIHSLCTRQSGNRQGTSYVCHG